MVDILPQIVPPSRSMKRSDTGHDNPKPGVSEFQVINLSAGDESMAVVVLVVGSAAVDWG